MKPKRTSVSKTFQAGTDYHEVFDFITTDNRIETHDYQPEGTDWSGGEPGPFDPKCELKHKYIITITKVEP